MRTKALFVAALLAAGLASSMAQNVYSLNVVGYYNVTIPGNAFAIIANQFNTTNNTIGSVLASVPVNTEFYKFNNGYTAYQFDEFDVVWKPDGLATLNPGEGGFIKNPGATPLTLTFVGEVPQGGLTNALPVGFSIRSSKVPQAGTVTTQLGLPADVNDEFYKYTPGTGYTAFQFDEFDVVWKPTEPQVSVGEGFFVKKVNAANWVRNFTVPQTP
jgi:hypothetical protein